MLKVTTTGNATLIAYDGKPVIVTDPWFGDEEPAYFGSWVLSHRIPAQLKEDIARCGTIRNFVRKVMMMKERGASHGNREGYFG